MTCRCDFKYVFFYDNGGSCLVTHGERPAEDVFCSNASNDMALRTGGLSGVFMYRVLRVCYKYPVLMQELSEVFKGINSVASLSAQSE